MHSTFRAFLGLALLPAAGCQSFAPYGPGYPGNYPNNSGMPQGTNAPRGAASPAGATTWNGAGPPQYAAPNQGYPVASAAARSGPSQPMAGGAPKLVPDYPDSPGGQSATGGTDEFPRRAGSPNSSGAQLDSSIDDSEENVATLGDDQFAPPIPVRTASASNPIAAEPAAPGTKPAPSPYLYDRKTYKWLRGVVDYDDQHKSWRITFNPDPAGSEPYGGNLTLVNDEQLDTLLASDVVLVEGRIEVDRLDHFGKPMYRVETVQRLRPKGE